MKSTLIISALLFSGLTYAYTPNKTVDKAKEAKTEITNKVNSAEGMKQELSVKKDAITKDINKEGVEESKKELSKLTEEGEEASGL